MNTEHTEESAVTEFGYKYPLHERIGWARISVKAARKAGSRPDADMLELAAMRLPWEDEVPAEYAG